MPEYFYFFWGKRGGSEMRYLDHELSLGSLLHCAVTDACKGSIR